MNDVHGIPLPPNPYEKNATMGLLGKQYGVDIFWGNDEVENAIKEIAEARPHTFTLEAAADIFILGYIYGKRAERSRRNKSRLPSRGRCANTRTGRQRYYN